MSKNSMNKNTKKSERLAEKAFRQYLDSQDITETDFWDFTPECLNPVLSKFCFAVWQTDVDDHNEPKRYKVQSLKTLSF